MTLVDLVKTAYWNMCAGKKLVRKMVFGMVFIQILVICFAVITGSYFLYKEQFALLHKSDCYYYSRIAEQSVTPEEVQKIVEKSRQQQETCSAAGALVLCDIESTMPMEAGQVRLVLDNEVHTASYEGGRITSNTFYKNIRSKQDLVELVLFESGMSLVPECQAELYGSDVLVGRCPDKPGEIMLDDYILGVFGFEESGEELIGKTVSFLHEEGDWKELMDYTLTGIVKSAMLAKRETVNMSDSHVEHVYVNLKEEDRESFHIYYGSMRCYFCNYKDYVNHYDKTGSLLQLNMDEVRSGGMRLTTKGMEYCILSFLMENVGKILAVIAGVTALIVTCSMFYIFKFYADRQEKYMTMLCWIGMEQKDRRRISALETVFMLGKATIFAVYFSVIFLLLLNYVTGSLLDFRLKATGAGWAVVSCWAYFFLCKALCTRIFRSF